MQGFPLIFQKNVDFDDSTYWTHVKLNHSKKIINTLNKLNVDLFSFIFIVVKKTNIGYVSKKNLLDILKKNILIKLKLEQI